MDGNDHDYLGEVEGELSDSQESSDAYEPSESALDTQDSSSATEEASDSFHEESDDFHDDPDFKMKVNLSENRRGGKRKRSPEVARAVLQPRKIRIKRKRQPEISPATVPKRRKSISGRRTRGNSPSREEKMKEKSLSPSVRAKICLGRHIHSLRSGIRQFYERKSRRQWEDTDDIIILIEQKTRGRQSSRVVERCIESENFSTFTVVLPKIDDKRSKAVAVIGIPDETKATLSSEQDEIVLYRDLEELVPVYSQMTKYCELCGEDHSENWSHDYLFHDLRRLPSRWRCKRCQRTFASVMAFTRHRPCQTDVFSCSACSRPWSEIPLLFRHTLACLEQGPIPNYQCRLDAAYVLSVHNNKTIKPANIVVYRCRRCPRSFTTATETAEHSIVHETSRARRDGEHTCKYCHFTFTNAKACFVHESLHPDLQCPSCAVRFLNIDSLQRHMSTCFVIKDIPLIYQNCGFCGLSGRENHMSTTVVEKKCVNTHAVAKLCRTCGKVFKSQTKLGEHLRKVHREPVNTFCERCNTWFPTRYLLMVHRTSRCYKVRPRRLTCRFCRVRFASRIALRRHQLKANHYRRTNEQLANKPNIFSCPTCIKSFTKRHQLSLHIRLAHAGNVHECPACGLKFMSRALVAAHRRVYHAVLLFQCHICQKRIRSLIGLDQHLINAHFQRFNCKMCFVTFEFEQDFEHHLSLHTNGEKCEKCGEKPHVLIGYKRRFRQPKLGARARNKDTCVKLKHNRLNALKWRENAMKPLRLKVYLKCLVCHQSFAGNEVLHSYQSHWNQHALGNQTLSKCPVCVYDTTEGPTDVFSHMMYEHPDKFHKCLKCALHFTNKETLEFHSKYCHLTPCWQLSTINVMNSFLKCLECDLLFIDHSEVTKHASSRHVKQREGFLPCPRCLMSYPVVSPATGLKHHDAHVCQCRHNASVSCHLCTDVGDTDWFFLHMRKKHGVLMVNDHPQSDRKPHTCPHCGQELGYLAALQAHLFRHHRDKLDTNSRLFRLCSICGKEIFYGQLGTHMKTCSTERKFQCDECDAKFKLKHHLQSHQRSFHGKEGFKCRECGKEFKLRWKRTKHGREMHGKTGGDSD